MRSGWRCSTCCTFSPAGAGAGRTRRRAVARPGVGGRAPGRAPAAARRAGRSARDDRGSGRSRAPASSSSMLRRVAARAVLGRPAQPGRAPQAARGAARPRLTRPSWPASRRRRPATPSSRSSSGASWSARARRPDAGRALPVPEQPARAARRPPGSPAGRDRRRPALVASLARPTVELVAAAHGDRDACSGDSRRRPRGRRRARRLGGSASPTRCSRRSLRAGAGLEAPRSPPGLGGAVTDLEERARHLALAADGPDAVVASELDPPPSMRRPAGAPPPRRAVRARRGADAGRSGHGAAAAVAGRRGSTVSRATLDRAIAMLERLLAEVRRASSAPTSSSSWRYTSRATRRWRACATKRSPRRPVTTSRSARILGFRAVLAAWSATARGARRCAGGAREGGAPRRSRA